VWDRKKNLKITHLPLKMKANMKPHKTQPLHYDLKLETSNENSKNTEMICSSAAVKLCYSKRAERKGTWE
jgi:hypothetical protein